MDPQWGHVTIKMSGHPPFGSSDYSQRPRMGGARSQKARHRPRKRGQLLYRLLRPDALVKIADSLASGDAIGRLYDVCDRWIYSACLCFGLPLDEQEKTGFRYAYSAFQLEYSRNLQIRTRQRYRSGLPGADRPHAPPTWMLKGSLRFLAASTDRIYPRRQTRGLLSRQKSRDLRMI